MLKDSYEIAKKRYSDLGIDTDSVIVKHDLVVLYRIA